MYKMDIVRKHVSDYLEKNNLGTLVDVIKKSSIPGDEYLYMVIAKKENKTKLSHSNDWDYSCWTSWNESTKSLNYGHYNLPNEDKAREILSLYKRN